MIIWDKLFGSFVPEDEEVVYGITKPLASFNPFWANLHYFAELAQRSWHLERWRDKVWVWWAPPEWLGKDETPPKRAPQTRAQQVKYDLQASPQAIALSLAIFGIIMAATLVMIIYGKTLSLPALIAVVLGVYMLLWIVTWGRSPQPNN